MAVGTARQLGSVLVKSYNTTKIAHFLLIFYRKSLYPASGGDKRFLVVFWDFSVTAPNWRAIISAITFDRVNMFLRIDRL